MTGELGAYWKTIYRGREFHLQAVTRGPRQVAIQQAEAAVQRQRGDVLDFKAFSDLSLCMIVELPGAGVLALLDELAALGWHVEVEPERAALVARTADRLEGTVQLTFPEGDGSLVIPLPRVPG